ncbi:hypothetical protein SAMN05216389_1383 [Oceanobacillus limi]|uniref:Uncharacterized protein n=1 Tax=Oceanobacillus limi TaxID=930131 RepID=A0A1I0HK94_9BACI|nr:hypothetical protein [Oceanobacillus limi]SET84293.1 hypothetical protein SAMN05216389_1383 [Oceanobacillus limi]
MFKNAEKISKAIDNLIKIADGLEKDERKQELVNVIHELSCVHQNVLGDLTNKSFQQENELS